MSEIHILVIKVDAHPLDHEPPDVHFEIECPGVTDACRTWTGCTSGDHDPARGNGIHHGVPHIYVEGDYLVGSDRCHLMSDSEMLPAAAEDLWADKGLKAGRYQVRHTYHEGDVDTLVLAGEVSA